MSMSDFVKTQLQETGRVNVQGMTVADIVEGLEDLGIRLDEAWVHNIMGVTLRVRATGEDAK